MWVGWRASALVLLFVLLPPSAAGQEDLCHRIHQDQVVLPSGTNPPVSLIEERVESRLFIVFVPIAADAATPTFYALAAQGEPFLGMFPDFNAAFFKKVDGSFQRIHFHADPGDQSGNIPTGTQYVGVYMDTGPAVGVGTGSRFTLTLSCPGS